MNNNLRKRQSASVKRSFAKSITFRFIILVADFIVIYLITHRIDVTVGVTLYTNISSTLIYYLHERFWNKVDII